VLRLDDLDLIGLVGQRAREDLDDVADGAHLPVPAVAVASATAGCGVR